MRREKSANRLSIPHHPVRRVSGAAPRTRRLATFSRRSAVKSGKSKVTDGPFTEAKEVVGGYWVIQVKSREEALEWASRIPGQDDVMVEVRRLFDLTDFDPETQKKIQERFGDI